MTRFERIVATLRSPHEWKHSKGYFTFDVDGNAELKDVETSCKSTAQYCSIYFDQPHSNLINPHLQLHSYGPLLHNSKIHIPSIFLPPCAIFHSNNSERCSKILSNPPIDHTHQITFLSSHLSSYFIISTGALQHLAQSRERETKRGSIDRVAAPVSFHSPPVNNRPHRRRLATKLSAGKLERRYVKRKHTSIVHRRCLEAVASWRIGAYAKSRCHFRSPRSRGRSRGVRIDCKSSSRQSAKKQDGERVREVSGVSLHELCNRESRLPWK